MKVFITASFRQGKNHAEIEHLCSIVRNAGFDYFCFAKDLEATFDNPREMMQRAKEEIEKCDVLLFDATITSTSRALETGIAYHAGKRIIVIFKKGTVIKDPLKGVADFLIPYSKIDDIQNGLKRLKLEWAK